MKLLEVPMGNNDAGAATVGEYLRKLLATLWEEDECFSGKRPFGNSGWKYEVYTAMVKAGIVTGTLDSDGYVQEVAQAEADALIIKAIGSLQWEDAAAFVRAVAVPAGLEQKPSEDEKFDVCPHCSKPRRPGWQCCQGGF